MAFKINVSYKGKTIKFEIENESLVGTKIGDKISGKEIDKSLDGYEVGVTGTSDKAGFPGFEKYKGAGLKRVLLTYGPGMHKKPRREGKWPTQNVKGLRLRKTVRGNEISLDTIQINLKVLKEGAKKFEDLLPKKEVEGGEKPSETFGDGGGAEKVSEVVEKKEAPKEEVKVEEKVEEKKEEKKEEVKSEEKKE